MSCRCPLPFDFLNFSLTAAKAKLRFNQLLCLARSRKTSFAMQTGAARAEAQTPPYRGNPLFYFCCSQFSRFSFKMLFLSFNMFIF